MTDLFDRVVLPVASPEDARATSRAARDYLTGSVVAVHVVEKAGGAPDKAGVEQREERAERIFEIVEATLAGEPGTVETDVLYGTDVADAIMERARELDASAIAFTPRGASRWKKLITGDVAQKLISKADRPVLILPDEDDHD